MSKPTKIKSFTLTETMVTLAISTIVAGLAFTIITLFTHNMDVIGENYSLRTELQLLESRLTIDIHSYSEVRVKNDGVVVFSTPIDSVSYSVSDSLLIRENDTLLRDPYKLNYFLRGELVKNGLVDAIKLETTLPNTPYLFVFKNQDAKTSMDHYGN